jgi:antitoxin FitA
VGSYPWGMPETIQIHNVSEALHCRLKSRAALEGMSLSDYLLAELRRVDERPTFAEMRERLERRPATDPSPSPEEAIPGDRDRRRKDLVPVDDLDDSLFITSDGLGALGSPPLTELV